MKNILLLIILAIFSISSNAQQDFIPTNFEFTKSVLNPAYAGSRDGLSVSLLIRDHWIGTKGAPFTFYGSAHSPIYKRILGAGTDITIDRVGSVMKVGSFYDISGRLKLSKEKRHFLSFGIKTGVDFLSVNNRFLGIRDNLDPYFEQNYYNIILPNIGFGIIFEHSNFYVGYSIPKLIENSFDSDLQNTFTDNFANQRRQHILMSGAILNIVKSKKVQFMPSFLLLVQEGIDYNTSKRTISHLEQKIILKFIFLESFWLSPAYSYDWNNHKVSFLAGAKLFNRIAFAYTFDYRLASNSIRYNNGAHEFAIRYDLIYNPKRNMENPRYF